MDMASAIRQLAPAAVITHSAPLTGGVSADVQLVSFVADDEAARLVVRRHRDITGKPDRRERAAREYALLGVLRAHGVPAPRARLFVAPDTLLLDWVEGETTLPEDPVEPLAAALAAIHTIGADVGLPTLPLLTDPIPALCEWLGDYMRSDEIRSRCVAYGGAPRLLHCDYWPGNVLWHQGRLVAVLDWEDAALGDPLADVAVARAELYRARDAVTVERFTAAYARRATLDATRLPWWDLFVSTAALQYMDGWGLPAHELATRRAATAAWQARAFRTLGLDR
jgi:aminoglycoside phosphotransferase (APT) family kinase protein